MNKLTILLTFSILTITIAFAQQTVAGRYKIQLNDPVGDVKENNGKPGKDVTKVSITSNGEELNIVVQLKESIAYYLKEQLAGPVIEMHFNTDNNVLTGGIPFWGKGLKGYEYQVDLIACIKYDNNGLACLGSVGGDIVGYCSSYKISKYEQDKKMPQNINNVLNSTQKDISGNQIEITLPYSVLGIKSGSRILISIRESDSSFNNDSYFPNVFFIIK